jgi:hypothetical protein
VASVRTLNIPRFKEKVLKRLPQGVKDAVRAANEKNADEFMAKVRQIVPTDTGHLASTLSKQAGKTETAVAVGIGDAEEPAGPIEWGHKARDGSHVAGRPFFYPARRVGFKRWKGRTARAASKAIKEAVSGS